MLGGTYLASGIEHNENGSPTASGDVHQRMNEKRIRKFDPLHNRKDLFSIEGNPNAPLALVAWGSIAGVCSEAVSIAREEGLNVKLLVPYLVYPVAEGVYRDFFASVQRGLVVEQSHLGQFYRVLRMYVDLPKGVESMARSGANPFRPSEIVVVLHRLLAELQHSQAGNLQPQE